MFEQNDRSFGSGGQGPTCSIFLEHVLNLRSLLDKRICSLVHHALGRTHLHGGRHMMNRQLYYI